MTRERVAVLGSTGSIGENTLDVIGRNPDRFRVIALTANRNIEKLADQCARFDAELAVTADPTLERALASALRKAGCRAQVLSGETGLKEAAGMSETDTVMAAIVGAAGLGSTFEAARRGKKILLANKESLVIAGEVFVAEARKNRARVLPVDSEHNAIFQALPEHFEQGLAAVGVEKIILTASGGPFPRASRGPVQQRNAGTSLQPSQLEHGKEDFHRLRHADEQRPGSDRGTLAV